MPRILLVDDEPDILLSLQQLLQAEWPAMEILTAPSGPAALRLIAERRTVDLIVSDLRMPEMDGVEFLQRAKALVPTAQLVLMTAYPEPAPAVETWARRKAGIVGFHPKTHPIEDLVDLIAMTLRLPPAR